MSINFVSLIFIWFLPLTASSTVTSGQNHNFSNVMKGEVGNKFTYDQLTTQEASSSTPFSEVSGHNITQSLTVEENRTEEKTKKPSTKTSLRTTRILPPKKFIVKIQTVATPTNSISPQLNSPTVGIKSTTEAQFKVTTSATTMVTSQKTNTTTTTKVPSIVRSSTQSQDTEEILTSRFTSDKMTHPSTSPTQSTNIISITFTEPVENKSTSTSQPTGADAMHSTGLYKNSLASTYTASNHITEKSQGPPEKKTKFKNETNHSKAVAGLIGGALVLMMVGFLVICIKKQKLQRQQITTRDWAGPSPFLEGGADNRQVTLRSSNRISLSSFLPQRLSKRLSLLPETDEELKGMTPGTTFGDKHQESISDRKMDGNDVQESNGTAIVPQMKSTGDTPETVINSVSVSSSQTNDSLSTNTDLEVTTLSEDHPANPPTLSGAMENALAQLNDGRGQL